MFRILRRSGKEENHDTICRLIVQLSNVFQNVPRLSLVDHTEETPENVQYFSLITRLFGTSPCKPFLVLPFF